MALNCKIKDSTLKVNLIINEVTTQNKLLRGLVVLRKKVKQALNIPIKTKVIRLSGDSVEIFGAKKELNRNILTEIKTYKNKQIINVKTEIENKYLNPIP